MRRSTASVAARRTPRLADLKIGQAVKVKLSASKDLYSEQVCLFGGIHNGEARFIQVDLDGRSYTWEAYRYNGRWSYGSSAQRLSLVEVLG